MKPHFQMPQHLLEMPIVPMRLPWEGGAQAIAGSAYGETGGGMLMHSSVP